MADKIAVTVDEVFSKLTLEEVSLIKNYLTLLFKWHATDNIVSSSDQEYVIKREIYDSSALSQSISGSSITDVGSGGGIPGIIVAILNPNKKVTLIDRKTTFIDFLEIVKSELKLKNVVVKKQDFFDDKYSINSECALFKNFSNKKIAKMDFENKLKYLIGNVKKSKSVSKVYILTGTPVLQLSKQFHEDYKMNVNKIASPYFDTSRYIAEVHL